MQRRSFHLTTEDVWKLQNVHDLQEHSTVSETLRFCIDFTYTAICPGQPEANSNEMLELLKKNNVMLRFLLVELTKLHRGEVEPLTEVGRTYLANLKKQLEAQLEKTK